MRLHIARSRTYAAWALLVALVATPIALVAQQGAVTGPGGVAIQGVYVDADGVLRAMTATEQGDRLARLRKQAAAPRERSAAAKKSPLRKVSLARLARRLRSAEPAQPLSDEMRFLAGVQQVRYVFGYPDDPDVIIAGPAEAWETDAAGRVVGETSARPVLHLEDLTVALGVFRDGGQDAAVGCSIDHTEEGLRRLKEYVARVGRTLDRRQIDASLMEGVRDSLGLQNVALYGVPADTRLAMVLLEADYRMKLIGIGLEDPRVRGLASYVSLLGPGSGGTSKLQRWWFVPDYEAILASPDGTALELRGQRVRLLAADDVIKATGQVDRRDSADPTNRRFAQGFTKHYEELARTSPIFAELQNAFDVVLIAALVAQGKPAALGPGELDTLAAPDRCGVAKVVTPKHVASVVNYKFIGNRLALPVGGGVMIEPSRVMSSEAVEQAADLKLRDAAGTRAAGLDDDRWWWD